MRLVLRSLLATIALALSVFAAPAGAQTSPSCTTSGGLVWDGTTATGTPYTFSCSGLAGDWSIQSPEVWVGDPEPTSEFLADPFIHGNWFSRAWLAGRLGGDIYAISGADPAWGLTWDHTTRTMTVTVPLDGAANYCGAGYPCRLGPNAVQGWSEYAPTGVELFQGCNFYASPPCNTVSAGTAATTWAEFQASYLVPFVSFGSAVDGLDVSGLLEAADDVTSSVLTMASAVLSLVFVALGVGFVWSWVRRAGKVAV